jgi:hypothetical protein
MAVAAVAMPVPVIALRFAAAPATAACAHCPRAVPTPAFPSHVADMPTNGLVHRAIPVPDRCHR